jgi:hypothetical protein
VKCRWLLQQAVPAVMLVMQVIDETKQRRYLVSWDEQIYVSSDEPISGNSADKQNGPPMNADKRRWNKTLCLSAFIRVHRRPNTNLPNSAQGLRADGQHLTPSFQNVMFHLVCGSHLSQCLRPLNE